MKKVTAILQGCKLADKLFGLRERQIKTAITAARNDIEEQGTTAQIEYENLCKKLGEKDVSDYRSILNGMIKARNTAIKSAETLQVLADIEADLGSEVEVEDGRSMTSKSESDL